MVYQAEGSECSLACVTMICGYWGLDASLLAMRELYPLSLKGATLNDLAEMAKKVDMIIRPVRCEPVALKHLKMPAMIHWDFEHFVVLKAFKNGKYIIHDPAIGILTLSQKEFSDHFTGIAIEFTPAEDFYLGKAGERLTLTRLFQRTSGLVPFFLQVIWMTGFLEFFALLSPAFLKTIVDSGLGNDDFDFITALTVGFIGVAVLHGVLNLLRDYLIIYFGSTFNLQLMRNLFNHMLRLPMAYYEKRLTGDLIDRYQSTNAIRHVFTSELPSVLLDGLVTLISLGIIFYISPTLGLIALVSFLSYLTLRSYCYRPMRTLSEKAVRARSEENAHVIDTLRGMQPIKTFAKETERLNVWSNYYAKLINSEKKVGMLTSLQNSLKIVITGSDLGLSVYVGANLVASNQISLGMLFAFFVYKAHFKHRSTTMIERMIELRLVDVHLDRLADIALSLPEQNDKETEDISFDPKHFRIEFQNVSFKYGPLDPLVFDDISFTISAGDSIALIGPSGCGKTTLFKLILGLLQPSSGQVLFNGQSLDKMNMQQFRKLFGVVMQEDQLLTGTIFDNIAFFESSPDELRIRDSAQKALIWDEVDAMPMKMNSRVGDLGSSLSGGQKQRILLARALYHKPSIMLMDEGTANLDGNIENQLLDNMMSLNLTWLSIAHRPETIKRANRVLRLENGKLTTVLDPSGDAEELSKLSDQ